MSKASSGDNSSLELLLDTMCNTFGAVMFIAISLLVITAMLGKVNSASEPPADPETWRTMRSELESLEREYARSRDMLEMMKPFAEHLQQDPRKETLQRCLILKEENSRLENLRKIRLLQLETEKKLQQTLRQKTDRADQENIQKREELQTLESRRQQMEKSILFVSRTLATQKPESSLVFRYLRPNENAPYFFLLRRGRLWRIGPDLSSGVRVHPDVTAKRWNNFYECTPATPGLAVLDKDGNLSADVLRMIRSIPPDRFPSFQVYADSAREMFLLRETLKHEGIRHAFSTYLDRAPAGFAFRDHVRYETD